eukprot:COSAG02_NODE_48356_length_334_cov_0.872340_1_plen_62_part_10
MLEYRSQIGLSAAASTTTDMSSGTPGSMAQNSVKFDNPIAQSQDNSSAMLDSHDGHSPTLGK